jgi:hypothetical protein
MFMVAPSGVSISALVRETSNFVDGDSTESGVTAAELDVEKARS